MRVLCSSFGLLGVVHEVVLRVQPLTPVKIDYQVLTLKEFAARFAEHRQGAPGALRLHISPFNDQITVERRTLDETASISRSGIWQIRKSVMRNVLPAFGSTVGSVLARARRGRRRSLGRAAGAARDARPRGSARGAVRPRMDPRLAAGSLEVALHLYVCGRFRKPNFPKLLGRVFRLLQSPITSSTATAATSSTARAGCTRIAIRCSA